MSRDCVQFDPDRKSAGKLLIENCTFWTGPLPVAIAGFKKGQSPGENAFDSKTPTSGPRCELTIRSCLMYGWNQPGQINVMAALNIKENVQATIRFTANAENRLGIYISLSLFQPLTGTVLALKHRARAQSRSDGARARNRKGQRWQTQFLITIGSMLTRMVMKSDAVSESSAVSDADIDYEHEHRRRARARAPLR